MTPIDIAILYFGIAGLIVIVSTLLWAVNYVSSLEERPSRRESYLREGKKCLMFIPKAPFWLPLAVWRVVRAVRETLDQDTA